MADSANTPADGGHHDDGENRRDFLYLAGAAMGAVGAGAVAWPLIHSMNPSADVLALSSIEVDIASRGRGPSDDLGALQPSDLRRVEPEKARVDLVVVLAQRRSQ